jgi:1,4-dihydroxy-2-naphthoate octaprenyltransferase
MGLAAILAAIKYTVGSNPYGYAGLGDFFVLIFFGLVGVGGSYFLYTQSLDYLVLFPSLTCGLLAVGVLNVNNIRDIHSDAQSGKKSIPVRIGRKAAVLYHILLLLASVLSAAYYLIQEGVAWYAWMYLLTLPLLAINVRAVIVKKKEEELDPFLRQLAITTLILVLLFGMGLNV